MRPSPALRAAWAATRLLPVLGLVGLVGTGCREGGRDELEREAERATVAPATEPAGEGAATERCAAGPVERRPLVLPDGLHAYVEPMNLIRAGDDLVVVGIPTYAWEIGTGPVRMASANEHVAAYLDDDRPRLVRAPLDGALGMVRAVSLDAGRWGVLFSETERTSDGSTGAVIGLGYTEYDGERWSPVESVPLPATGRLFPASSSPLVPFDGALHWVVIRNPGGAVLHYRRRAGDWSWEPIADSGLEAAGLAAGPDGAWLALSGLDPAISGPRKSVRLFHWEGGWRLVGRDPTEETYTEIRAPSVMASGRGATVTWSEIRGAGVVRARVGVGPDDPGMLVTIDEVAPAVRPLTTTSGEPAWVVWHAGPIPGVDELRLVRLTPGGTVEVAQVIPYPYTGYFAAVVAEPDQVLVTGSEFSPDPARPTVRSLTLRLNPSCQ